MASLRIVIYVDHVPCRRFPTEFLSHVPDLRAKYCRLCDFNLFHTRVQMRDYHFLFGGGSCENTLIYHRRTKDSKQDEGWTVKYQATCDWCLYVRFIGG